MVAETAKSFEALERQAQTLMGVFVKAGHEAVAPSMIQPADVFLDVIGEALRARTYVFTDHDGDELCLRPDLTVPTCRLHIERHPAGTAKARYCYNGPAFRFQPQGADSVHPREFRQAGIEAFGHTDREKADAQIVATTIEALRAAGLKDFRLRIGDLGLFRAVLKAAQMPERWRMLLAHHFWRPDAFRSELKRLVSGPGQALAGLPADLIASLDPVKRSEAEKKVGKYLETQGLDLVGVRSVGEITESLLDIVEDGRAEPLPAATAQLIESYLGVTAPARAAGARLKDLMRDRGVDITGALESFHRRLQLMTELGVDVVHADFTAEFGRTLEYYTGFVFEVLSPALGPGGPVAGGGRYDSLMRSCGAPEDVPAVGAAIHTERLLAAIEGSRR
jgi:ATP phosphoribosyltransferase regulatory subunit